ncbi:DUF1772-domain-containing protein [Mytilinidion resinicola]|uniref:DUF1772-domain-containing protein n=1 Tax=Mytilinidion resinicola TaxID=574789 RepID=A0A6A6YJ15_9PEZI|nr:DUF1772-domain-containing protein [Mytilinidion resinicola]KAF2807945.1 DUF1772-domain-containing protein [Mytilinidion resinicola]
MASLLPLSPSSTSLLQGYAIISAALAAGTNLSTSFLTIPTILLSPHPLLLAQWTALYSAGITPMVTLSMTSTTAFAVLAYASHASALPAAASTAKLYGVAAAAAFAMAPWTRLVMWGTNQRLLALNQEREQGTGGKGVVEAGEEPVDRLVERWAGLNVVRGVASLGAAVVGGLASLA